MAETFARHWLAEIELWVYSEALLTEDVHRLARFKDLHSEAGWLASWQERYATHRGVGAGRYNYMRDAIRFSHKVAAVAAAAAECVEGTLIWLDADVITHQRVTPAWLDSLMPESATLGWLDRHDKYPECGFVMYRLPQARQLIDALVAVYISGELFKLPGQTDCHALQRAVALTKPTAHSLSGDGRLTPHPFVNSRLAERMDHLKGPRKEVGRSRPTDLKLPRGEAYWRW